MKLGEIILGIDVGGTFTDFVSLNLISKKLTIFKTPSTPEDFTKGIIKGIVDSKVKLENVFRITHGTTVVTNAVIQRDGVPTLLLTTKGFKDVLEIRRTTRGELYNIQWDPPAPLIPRTLRIEVDERTTADGNVIKEVDFDNLEEYINPIIIENNIKSIAISFINSYINPKNELKLKEFLEKIYPNIFIITSSEILPVWREFERTCTTCIAAYVGPIILNYINKLRSEMQNKNYNSDIFIMLSNGGSSTPEDLKTMIPQTVLSGPVAGVIASKELLNIIGEKNIIDMDIGGTSTDISIIHNGEYLLTNEFEIEFGTVIYQPVIDVNTIGAGGGSIAWIDSMGVLRVGPRSAGSIPGPACYDLGGDEPTITDANVVLGRLNQEYLLNGALKIDKELSFKVIEEKITDELGLNVYEAAQGIIDIANNNIANAIRQKTVQKGIDPREFVLFSYGGAGPLHSSEVASILEIPRIIIPLYPGVNSAVGLTYTDIRYDFMKTFVERLDEIRAYKLDEEFVKLEKYAINKISFEVSSKEKYKIIRTVDARYEGQTHELNIKIDANRIDERTIKNFKVDFKERHNSEFGHAKEIDYPIEIVNIRIAVIIMVKKPIWPKIEEGTDEARETGKRRVYLKYINDFVTIPIFRRDNLKAKHKIIGPAIIEQYDSTILIMKNQKGTVDEYGNLWIT